MTLMFSYCKNTSLACNIADGYNIKKTLASKEPLLKKREIEFSVSEVPSILDYFSYMYFGGSAISGPWFEFKDLMQFFKAEGHYKDVHSAHTLIPGLKSLASVAILVVWGTVLSDIFEFDLNTTITSKFQNEFSFSY